MPRLSSKPTVSGIKCKGYHAQSAQCAYHSRNACCIGHKLVARGAKPMVMVNPNTAGKEAANLQNDANYEALWQRLRDR